MTTQAGERNRRIAFERGAETRGGLGREPLATWGELGRRWAKVLFGTGQERREAAGEQAALTGTFRVLSDSLTRGVTEADRIVCVGGGWGGLAGRAWDITSIAPIGLNDEIEFTATTARETAA